MFNNRKLLTPDEVSRLLGVTKHTLAVWRSSGRYNLSFVKTGRLVRYHQSDVDRFLNEHYYQSTGVPYSGAKIS